MAVTVPGDVEGPHSMKYELRSDAVRVRAHNKLESASKPTKIDVKWALGSFVLTQRVDRAQKEVRVHHTTPGGGFGPRI